MNITLHELAIHRGANPNGPEANREYLRVGVPHTAGCESCKAFLEPDAAYPSKTGYVRCADCIGDLGYETVQEANADIFDDEGEEADAIRRLQTELAAEIVEEE